MGLQLLRMAGAVRTRRSLRRGEQVSGRIRRGGEVRDLLPRRATRPAAPDGRLLATAQICPLVLARLTRRCFLLPVIGAAVLLVGCGSASKGPTTRTGRLWSACPSADRGSGRGRIAGRPAGRVAAGGGPISGDGRGRGSAAADGRSRPGHRVGRGHRPRRPGRRASGSERSRMRCTTQRAPRWTARRTCSGAGSRPTATSSPWTPTGRATVAGHLPVGASDVAAGVIGGTVYVVGGYTGVVPLDTIVAWSGSGTGRVVGAPSASGALRGGGGDRRAADRRRRHERRHRHARGLLVRSGRWAGPPDRPASRTPLTHAAGAALGGRVYVIGGRGADQGTPDARDPGRRPGERPGSPRWPAAGRALRRRAPRRSVAR